LVFAIADEKVELMSVPDWDDSSSRLLSKQIEGMGIVDRAPAESASVITVLGIIYARFDFGSYQCFGMLTPRDKVKKAVTEIDELKKETLACSITLKQAQKVTGMVDLVLFGHQSRDINARASYMYKWVDDKYLFANKQRKAARAKLLASCSRILLQLDKWPPRWILYRETEVVATDAAIESRLPSLGGVRLSGGKFNERPFAICPKEKRAWMSKLENIVKFEKTSIAAYELVALILMVLQLEKAGKLTLEKVVAFNDNRNVIFWVMKRSANNSVSSALLVYLFSVLRRNGASIYPVYVRSELNPADHLTRGSCEVFGNDVRNEDSPSVADWVSEVIRSVGNDVDRFSIAVNNCLSEIGEAKGEAEAEAKQGGKEGDKKSRFGLGKRKERQGRRSAKASGRTKNSRCTRKKCKANGKA